MRTGVVVRLPTYSQTAHIYPTNVIREYSVRSLKSRSSTKYKFRLEILVKTFDCRARQSGKSCYNRQV